MYGSYGILQMSVSQNNAGLAEADSSVWAVDGQLWPGMEQEFVAWETPRYSPHSSMA